MGRRKNKTAKNDESFSTNAVQNDRLSQHEKDVRLLARVKAARAGKKYRYEQISKTPNTWIEKEVKG